MPKKTKREKILAELHRKLAVADLQSRVVKSQNKLSPSPLSTSPPSIFQYKTEMTTKPKTLTFAPDYSYVRGDLIKITIFTLIALASQSVLYFMLRTK